MNRKSLFVAAVLGLTFTLPALAQFTNPNADIPGSGPAPTPVPQPTPVVTVPTPPPAPVVPPPTPAPTHNYTSPLLVGQGAGSQGQTVQTVLGALNNQIANFNSGPGPDLPTASTTRSNQVIVSASTPSAPPAPTPAPVRSGFSNPNSDFANPTPDAPSTPAPSTPPPSNPGITQINVDVTGWSYLVLQWGSTNYHFYVGDASGVQTFSGNAPLSSYTFFSSSFAQVDPVSVPETTSTLLLFGSALGFLGLVRRGVRRNG